MSKSKVLILGYGEMGHALEFLLKDKQEIFIWEKFPEKGFKSASLQETAAIADFIFFCLPITPHREILEEIAPIVSRDCIFVSIAKGLDEAGETAADIFSDVLDSENYALLYGPMISEEIRADRYAFADLGVCNERISKEIKRLFVDSKLFFEPMFDITGLSWSVILKNVYAILFGIADELKLGDNMRGFLASTSLQELNAIVIKMGGNPGTPYQLAGLGDLITTATSEDSHHHELGRKIARGDFSDISGEGVHTLQMVKKYKLFDMQDFPLFQLTCEILSEPKNIPQRIENYLTKLYTK